MANGEAVLLDSVILIDHLNGLTVATDYLREVAGRAHISAITQAELLAGFAPGKAASVQQLLSRFPLRAIDRAHADRAAQLRRQHGWKLPDAFQAAAAQILGAKLATRNARDFDPRQHEFVVIPYEIR